MSRPSPNTRLHRCFAAVCGLALALSTVASPGFELTILHINDHHSHLGPTSLDLKLGGEKTRVQVGGFPLLATALKRLESGHDNVLKLHAGDALSGNLYYTLFKGEASAAMMSAVCFDAFALGNHEFDDGDAGLARFLDYLREGGCETPVLAANVVPALGVSPLAPKTPTDYIRPWVIVKRGGARIGLVGIDIARKTLESSNPDAGTLLLDETSSAQQAINELRAESVDKIVLITHYTYDNDLILAGALSGVDIIVGGDSHTLLGNDLKRAGLAARDDYPVVATNLDGDKVCVVTAWEYTKVVGELNAGFDDKGRITHCQGTAHLMLADTFKRRGADRKRNELVGAAREAVLADVEANPSLFLLEPDARVDAVLARFRDRVETIGETVIGEAVETLCLERIPGQGKSEVCDSSVTGARGSDIANIVARGFLEMSRTSDVAVQNSGGVRTDVLPGPITIGDAYQLLPFSNTLVELQMTGAEIQATLEDAFDYALTPDGSTGAYPYASGLRWTADRSAAKGERIRDLEVNVRLAGDWAAIDPAASYKVVTNSYIATGKDGYTTMGEVYGRGKALNTYLDYAQSYADYVKAVGKVEKLPVAQYSTRAFIGEDGEQR